MATPKVIVEGSSVTASQMKDFWRQASEGTIDGAYMQAILSASKERRAMFTDGCRFERLSTLTIDRSTPFDPKGFVNLTGCSVRSEDERSLVIHEVDLNKVRLVKLGAGPEDEKQICLDAKVFEILLAKQYLIPESWNKVAQESDAIIFFDGTEIADRNGRTCILGLQWSKSGWTLRNWIKESRDGYHLTAVITVTDIEPVMEVFRTIKIGTHRSEKSLRMAIEEGGSHISDHANQIMRKGAFSLESEETELDLVVLSKAELGLKRGATIDETNGRAKKFGLELCPPEVGPQLRLQYNDQPAGEWLLIGMEGITGPDDRVQLFSVGRNTGSLWLGTNYGDATYGLTGGGRFVFVRPRK